MFHYTMNDERVIGVHMCLLYHWRFNPLIFLGVRKKELEME